MIEVLLSAIALFVVTNVDDIFILLGFFAEKHFKVQEIVAGQCIGISLLFCVSASASFLSLVLSRPVIGLLGLAPILIGATRLYRRFRRTTNGENQKPSEQQAKFGGTLAVTAVTVSNGGDNISIYTPAFALYEPAQLAVIGCVFLLMTLTWCATAFALVSHPKIGSAVRNVAQLAVPILLIVLGLIILWRANSLSLFRVFVQ